MKQFWHCRCHQRLGNAFWLLPPGVCFFGGCDLFTEEDNEDSYVITTTPSWEEDADA